MRIKSFILAAMALVTIAVSCEPKKPALGVTIDPKALSFSADGGTQSVKASSSDVWTVSVPDIAKEWLQVSPLSGSGEVNVTITASANPGKPRSVSVIFACGLYDATLPISQEGMQKAGDGKTLETAFSASEAHDWVLANVEAGDATPDRYFVKGIIHKMVTSDGAEQYFASNTYGNASFFISDDGQSSDQDFECFQVNYLGNRAWKKGDTDVKVGDSVTIYGYLINYQGKNGNVAETTGKGAAYLVVLNDTVVEPVIESKADPTGSGTLEDPYNVAAA
ncbi:MAG: BACON domain-containing protein, partial [Bacteroidales bacterium]|nr:BACON domain-containing protein [Bacteroidales bacterium]